MRLLWLFLGLAVLVLIPFFIWGEQIQGYFTQAGAIEWLSNYGSWAWMAGMLLLAADLVLPLPATIIMTALGWIYGPLLGGAISAAGSFISGCIAYGLCRLFGARAARRLMGTTDYEKGVAVFSKAGGWLVALSRWIPVLPEVIACMAGLTRMPAGTFLLALACGSVPLGFVFAAVGNTGRSSPTLMVFLSAALPIALWLIVKPFVTKHAGLDRRR
jgi:uncharacterized membrane protein YdjX (TVP38/TMEM64 family)